MILINIVASCPLRVLWPLGLYPWGVYGGDMSSSEGTASYTVTGMTCGHCVASVTEEVTEIEGVRDVVVDLASGSLSVATDRPVPRETVEAAGREAGAQQA